ncbi:MAG: hypothetical protein AVDCRST_MAG49-2176 [uncultured Thermomicrobiales bacterium]|uniref:Uncharacterized protein n=1 Tax=uncultured Thermomicrobiales bacterium TaxID=1645740 RepID=A0A6J4UW03_9BACT|nr:MAG: hypothetical protein AVDCRST_MAG49-2176 [uncultured Thermomicrobiales bacterium]
MAMATGDVRVRAAHQNPGQADTGPPRPGRARRPGPRRRSGPGGADPEPG